MLAVEAVQVYKLYKGSNYAPLNNVSVDVEPGQIFTLLGRNGAGKTTFVRICATQLAPTKGIVRVLGYDILKEAGKIRNLISVVRKKADH